MKVLTLFLLIACASSKTVKGPDGTPHLLITCSQMGKCYEKAAEKCAGQFKPVETTIKEIPGYNGTTAEEIKLLVKCDKND